MVSLGSDVLFDKIVSRRRGGYCYELNGLFAGLLRNAGFEVKFLSARCFNDDGSLSQEFDHLALWVCIPGAADSGWLADVGFGDSFVEPLRLDLEGEQAQGFRAYRIEWDGEGRVVSQRKSDGGWERLFRFTMTPRSYPADFEEMNRYHQTSPASPFTSQRMCTLPTAEGRVTLWDNRLVVTAFGERTETPVAEEERAPILRERFGIMLG